MENFQYSIQLNDRDWAEFYSASEECSLVPAALAMAEEPGFSDIEQGDREAGSPRTARLITVRAGSTPAPGPGPCPLHGVPRETCPPPPVPGQLVLEEVLSGSEDEMDLGSGSRFLRESNTPGSPQQTPLMPSAQDRQLPCFSRAGSARPASHAMEKPFQAQDSSRNEVGQAAERAVATPVAVQAGRGLAIVPHGHQPEGAPMEGELPGEHLQGSPETAESERPVHAADVSSPALAASGGMERPAWGKANWSLCLEPGLPDPNGDISQNPSAEPLQPTCSRIPGESRPAGENPGERLGLGQALTAPGSPGDSPDVVQLRGPVHQGTLPAAMTPSHRAVALQSSTLAMEFLPSSALLRESKGEGVVAKPALGGLEGEDVAQRGGTLTCGMLGDEGRGLALGGQAVSAPRSKEVKGPAVQPFPGELKTSCARPKQATDLGIHENMSLNQSSKPTASQREECRSTTGKSLRLGSTVALGGDADDGAQGRQRSGLLGGMFPHHSAAEDSQEGAIPALTWPEMYDYFFCDTQEQVGEMNSLGGVAKTPMSPCEKEQEVPEMYGPEMYEYFFNEPEGSGEGGSKATFVEPERISTLEQTSSPCESREDPGLAIAGEPGGVISIPEVYEHFFMDRARDRRSWGRIFLSMPALEARKAVAALKSFLQKPMRLVRRSPSDRRVPVPRGSIKRLSLLQLGPRGRIQLKPEDLGMAPALAESPRHPLALTQEDMCLVFVAFASWAVKTSNLQAPDAWKTVLLANVGTLSAIRYFRRQAIEGRHGT
ncbi:PGC-1 and ERR-induced regulator in muscle protein 1 isoform X1 [Mauremys reevesii]|uniref:PGC-1 and ERR-induced regulator in muscle protein 1 isoform X1 n=1 Tax=Mauremys reevesii TaxID=260615 RepID=UPI00193F6CA8|nr:PGC-1 and ERR-induced regulator in muscle protein 1 isoform X1 [Mauremys reevesii]